MHHRVASGISALGALVLALMATGLQTTSIDALSVTLLLARIGQTLVHIGAPPTNIGATLRFALFFVQIVCMISIGTIIVLSTPK